MSQKLICQICKQRVNATIVMVIDSGEIELCKVCAEGNFPEEYKKYFS
jgi:ribosome-binding protein aMBF1 (putative translation factor)